LIIKRFTAKARKRKHQATITRETEGERERGGEGGEGFVYQKSEGFN
jgi:hypothetical protein